MNLPKDIKIKENSWAARIAAWKLGSDCVALVLARTIYLHNVSKEIFLQDKRWVAHELKHIQQFSKHGTFIFLWKYFIEWFKHGYRNNRYEIEAREAETSYPDFFNY